MNRITRALIRIEEEAIHAAIKQFLDVAAHPRLIWFHVPNGVPASKAIGARFVRLGMKAGVADLCFVMQDGRAAFMEVKSDKGRQTPEQRAFQLQCEAVGAPYEIVRSVDEAEQILRFWGCLKRNPMVRAA